MRVSSPLDATTDVPISASGYWTALLGRAIPAVALGLAITLNVDHSPIVGLIGFGLCALLSGAVIAGTASRAGLDATGRMLLLAQGVVLVIGGIVSLALSWAGPVALSLCVGITALIAGVMEFVGGLRARHTSPIGRDWIVAGAATAVLGAVALLVPPGFSDSFEGDNGIRGTLTGSIVTVGAIGAWGILIGVLLAIAAVSIRGRRDRARAEAAS